MWRNLALEFLRCGVIIPPLPLPIVNGTLADAAQLMANLQWIVDNVNANAAGGSSSVGRNALANGAMQVNQRLTGATPITLAATSGYTLDRWEGKAGTAQSGDFSQVTLAVGDLVDAQFAARVARTPLAFAVTALELAQTLETLDSIPLQDQEVTFSFYARCGANFSPAGALLTASIISGTGSDENVLAGFTGAATVATDDVVLTSDFARYQISGTIDAAATQVGVVFSVVPVGTAGADDSFDVANAQLEIAPAATPYDALPIASTLARCQRYFQKSFPDGIGPAQGFAFSFLQFLASIAGIQVQFAQSITFPTRMRATPSITFYNPINNNAEAYNLTRSQNCSATSTPFITDANMIVATTGSAATQVADQLIVQYALDAEL